MPDLASYSTTIAVVAGFGLDCLFGDPQNAYHPVRWVGFVIAKLTHLASRYKNQSHTRQFFSGMAISILVILLFFVSFALVITWVYQQNLIAGIVAEAVCCYFLFATKALYGESMAIYQLLNRCDLPGARKRLALIVGRDTAELNEERITKATIETVAENLSDGVIAPMFFMLIGGAPLGMAYKTINTLDSMIGYRNEKYKYFGKFAARLDDLANLIPARLSAGLLMIAAAPLGQDIKGGFSVYRRDRYNHLSPNSAHTEAVCAGVLGIQLGGNSSYQGQVVEKPTIGDPKRPANLEDIKKTANLMYLAAFLGLLFGVLLKVFLGQVS